jgi:hypothetical protein
MLGALCNVRRIRMDRHTNRPVRNAFTSPAQLLWYTLDYWLPTIPPTFLMVLLMRNVQQRREKRAVPLLGNRAISGSTSNYGGTYLGSSWQESPQRGAQSASAVGGDGGLLTPLASGEFERA